MKEPWKCKCGVMLGSDVVTCPVCKKSKMMAETAKKYSPYKKILEISPRRIKKSGRKWKGQSKKRKTKYD